MKIYINDKEFNGTLGEAIENCESYRDIKIENYEIGGGTGDVIREAYIGDSNDLRNFIEETKEYMVGYVNEEQEYTLAWHNGKFIKLYNDLQESIDEFGEDIINDFEEQEDIIFYDDIDEDIDAELYVFGIYNY